MCSEMKMGFSKLEVKSDFYMETIGITADAIRKDEEKKARAKKIAFSKAKTAIMRLIKRYAKTGSNRVEALIPDLVESDIKNEFQDFKPLTVEVINTDVLIRFTW